jgi:FkbM family methyltransferase
MNLLARGMRALMRARGVNGAFCVSPSVTYYEWDGLRLIYDYAALGVGGNIDAGGNSEPATRNKLLSLLKPGSVFFDVGAHEGLFSIDVKRHIPDAAVHAFEPLPAALEQNLALNRLPDVVVHRAAVGEEVGTVTMSAGQRSSNFVQSASSGIIPMVALDALDLPAPTAIKLDIEGFELHALKGARETIQRYRPVIITEINHCFLRYHPDLTPLQDFMSGLGYRCHTLTGASLTPVREGLHDLSTLPHSEEANYWWLPEPARL